ncbi:hypothetical protein QWZ08_20065 [Ferruginibacter paludis]|uniref:hypothetical protein n=1 Tax=Ferruginibacter paludis TaxID=1310417 RepID=UPI0025B3EF17|nr:hypothetical protein [Ferruginibacter paludis]MDN3657960.1 hypothetical protein [Ferruginibacter paludis]
MTNQQYEYVGKWVAKVLPGISKIALCQIEAPKLLTEAEDVRILIAVFSDYYGFEFYESLPTMCNKDRTEYKMKFVALYLCCYDPATIKGLYRKKIDRNLRSKLAKILTTHPAMISQWLPKIKFYLERQKGYEAEIRQMIAAVKLEKEYLFEKDEALP